MKKSPGLKNTSWSVTISSILPLKRLRAFAGSSLMEMFPVEKFAHEDGLPVTVYNRGVGGFITDELIAAVDTCIIDLAPKKLFINIGTNDLSDASRSMEQIMSNYALILDKVKRLCQRSECTSWRTTPLTTAPPPQK